MVFIHTTKVSRGKWGESSISFEKSYFREKVLRLEKRPLEVIQSHQPSGQQFGKGDEKLDLEREEMFLLEMG